MVTDVNFAEFTLAEVEEICGPRNGPHLAWPEASPTTTVTLHDAMALMLRNEAVAHRAPPLSEALVSSSVPSMLWYALYDGSAVCDQEGQDQEEVAFEADYCDFIDQITGLRGGKARRFLLIVPHDEPQLLSESEFHSEFDAATNIPSSTGARIVDLMTTGLLFAERAGRPLVTIRRSGPERAAGPGGR